MNTIYIYTIYYIVYIYAHKPVRFTVLFVVLSDDVTLIQEGVVPDGFTGSVGGTGGQTVSGGGAWLPIYSIVVLADTLGLVQRRVSQSSHASLCASVYVIVRV